MGNWKDSRNHLSKQSLRKAANMLALYSSFHLSRLLKRSFHWGMPMSVSFEPTTACNLRCPECPSGLRSFTRPTGNLKKDLFERFVAENAHFLSYLNFYFQGEPYINPSFLDMVGHAADKGIYTSTSTNAHFITEEVAERTVRSGLDRLIISIDGTTQEVYEQYRKAGILEKVISGTKEVMTAKARLGSTTPHVVFQFLVVRPNEHQIEDVKRLATELGVDEVLLKTAQIYDYEHGDPLIPTIDEYSRYRKGPDGKWHLKNSLDDQCWKMWHSCVVTWDGRVVPCCFDKDAHHVLGDLNKESLKTLWRSAAYQAFRAQILKGRSQLEMCRNCSEGTKVWA